LEGVAYVLQDSRRIVVSLQGDIGLEIHVISVFLFKHNDVA